MSFLPHIANTAWMLGNLRAARAFERALENPRDAQREILWRYLRDAGSFGRAHGFRETWSEDEFQHHVPLSRHEDYAEYIARIAAGEPHVLTREPVTRFALTSGSSGAAKLVPYTRGLLREFARALAPWVVNLFQTHPAARRGPAYWSVTPVCATQETPRPTLSAIPIGLDDDAAYVGGVFRHLVDTAMAVPAAVRHINDMNVFRYVTLLCLLQTRELRLISVWHPSFLTLLLAAAEAHWDRLLDDITSGTVRPPTALAPPIARALKRGIRRDPRRAGKLRAAGPRQRRGMVAPACRRQLLG